MKKKIAGLTAGVLFALMLGGGCGKAAVENIASKKTEPETQTEEKYVPEEETGLSETVSSEEKEREAAMQVEPGETRRQKALREQLGIPETDQAEFVDENGILHKIDAKVTVPDTDGFMIASASEMTFGDEEIEKYIVPLLGEDGLYRWEPEEYADYKRWVASTEFRLKNGEYGDGEHREWMEEILREDKERLANLEQEARKEKIPPVMTLEEKADSGEYFDCLNGLTDWDQRTMKLLAAKYGFSLSPWNYIVEHSCTISGEEAKMIADSYVAKMGLSEVMVLNSVEFPLYSYAEEEARYGAAYIFYYTRAIGGVPVGCLDNGCGAGVTITVDDTGVLQMQYGDYVIKEGGEPAELLSFSEIQNVYKEEWNCKYPDCASVSVEEIRLFYDWNEGMETIVPVWGLFGSCEYTGDMERDPAAVPDRRRCLLLINAINGSIIENF